ncbi:hypothetical protein WJX84_006341 [Apatococcus fuscideae]|uniref:Phospholipid/glycerol acyltransferase domain-containing protein n=1 Tax=Apatococcus fuscideae TaxID=2026836 RepID=A0AAW1TBU4_9CHLO
MANIQTRVGGSPHVSTLSRYDTLTSPFLERQTPFNAWEAFKLVLLFPLAIPRLILGVSAVFVLAGMSFIAAHGWPIEKPMPPWRRNMVKASRHCAGFILLMLGFHIKVTGWKNVAEARRVRALGLFNHSSWVDAIAMMWLFAPSGVSRASNADIPVVGTCIRSFQNIYIPDDKLAREPHKQPASNASPMSNGNMNGDVAGTGGSVAKPYSQLIQERVDDRRFPMLMMAPEGTCGDNRCILHFRTGAFVPGVPVLPVLLKYRFKHHNPSWIIINVGWEFMRLMCQFYNRLDIDILPPYIPSSVEARNPAFYARNVREVFSTHMGLPQVDQSHVEFKSLERSGVHMSWDGRRLLAPEGLLQDGRFIDLQPFTKKSK